MSHQLQSCIQQYIHCLITDLTDMNCRTQLALLNEHSISKCGCLVKVKNSPLSVCHFARELLYFMSYLCTVFIDFWIYLKTCASKHYCNCV